MTLWPGSKDVEVNTEPLPKDYPSWIWGPGGEPPDDDEPDEDEEDGSQ